ncbi:RidA family protein [Mesobacterium pallidum]|uniref:RidA family protein n=1 Tax=Mesobacterium pallidum TaxID=2872037 RepID=UPI001EE336FE|nr:RidA family protein [Mesobacterium pallidum]
MTTLTRTRPEIVNPAHLPDTRQNGYSTAAITSGRVAHLSGQVGFDRTGGLSPDFATQVAQAYENLLAVIDALGARPEQVAKLTLFVVDHDMAKLGVLSEVTARHFGAEPPAQTLVGVAALALEPILFEVEAVVQLD